MNYIYSTLSASINLGGIVVNGGAGVAHSRTLETPRGVVTSCTDAQLETLQSNPIFQSYVKNGFFSVSAREQKIEKAVENMAKDSGSAQETEQSLGKKSQAKTAKKD